MKAEETIKQGVGFTNLSKTSAPNFCDDEGNVYLKICPRCQKENYALAVTSGICCWCGFDLNKFR